jgi:nucleotide-binding universal stress UspA family protein
MKKILKGALAGAVLIAFAVFIVSRWVKAGAAAQTVGILYAPGASQALDYDAVAEKLSESGIAASAKQSGIDVLADAENQIAAGSTVLVIGLDEAPADNAILKAADAKNADLFFVGTYPGDDFLNSYDKAYYIGSRPEYGGELGGQAAAMAYRNGVIADQTGNALLDYLAAGVETDTQKTLLASTLSECEHYGVYSESSLTAHAPADSSASSQAGTSLEKELLGNQHAAASSEAFVPDYSSLSEGAAALQQQWEELEYQPEIIYCFSAESLSYAEEYARASGWLDRACPVQLLCYLSSKAEAQQADDGICGTILYYDRDMIGSCVVEMIGNIAQQNYIAEGTGFSLDENSALWVPYQLYRSAENDVPAAAPDASQAADSAASSFVKS